MIEDLKVYYRPCKSIKSRIGACFYALLEPGFYAIILHRMANFLYKKHIFLLPLILMRINKLLTHVDISYQCSIGKRLRLPHCCDIVIGSTSIIGNDVEILNGVTLGAVDIRGEGKRHPTIEDGVFIGCGAKILGNIKIGQNSRIGANSVALESMPPKSTAVGIPAKIMQENQ